LSYLYLGIFLNLDSLLVITKNNFKITPANKNKVIELMQIDNNLLKKLAIFMEKDIPNIYFSYTMIDLNWNSF
jgi:hypothetical protein